MHAGRLEVSECGVNSASELELCRIPSSETNPRMVSVSEPQHVDGDTNPGRYFRSTPAIQSGGLSFERFSTNEAGS